MARCEDAVLRVEMCVRLISLMRPCFLSVNRCRVSIEETVNWSTRDSLQSLLKEAIPQCVLSSRCRDMIGSGPSRGDEHAPSTA